MMQVRILVCLLLVRAAPADETGAHHCSAGAFDCGFDMAEFVQTKLHIHNETRGRARRERADVELRSAVALDELADESAEEHMYFKPKGSAGNPDGDVPRPTLRDAMEKFYRFMWVSPSKYLILAMGGEMPLPRSFVAQRSIPQTSTNTVLQKVLVEPYKYCFFPVMLVMAVLLVPFLIQEVKRVHSPWDDAPIKNKLLSIGD
mmetsp:Transcript_94796/g.268360  ORF Transcript_94796/g.268360 Transcript_94796/m.268360 type:complete len:203 (-) Transcript_94796:43-651(-)